MKRTPEEVAAWKERLAGVAAKVRALPADRQAALAAEYGTVTAEGHQLSAYNSIFLAMQAGRPLAQVGGFRQWRKAGRMVSKGERAVGYMYVPMKRRNGDGDTAGSDGETDEKLRFRLVPVFDVTQTEAGEGVTA